MIRRSISRHVGFVSASLLVSLALVGCQGGGPNIPAGPQQPTDAASFQAQFDQLPAAQQAILGQAWDDALTSGGGQSTVSLGLYEAKLNLATGGFTLRAVPTTRNGQVVQDVTSVLANPACPNGQCVNFVLNGRDTMTGLTSYTLFLYNPSMTTVWDTRFIWTNLQDNNRDSDGELDTTDDVEILNAKGWTNEFDDFGPIPVMLAGATDYTAFGDVLADADPGWPVINPFHTLASNHSDESLGGQSVAFTEVEAIVRGDTATVQFIVTTSVGGQRQDPYEFGGVVQLGLMDDNISGTTQIRAVIRDHQDNIGYTTPPDPDLTHLAVELVAPEIYEFAPDDIIQLTYQPPNPPMEPEGVYIADLTNWQGERAGDFTFILRAHSDVNLVTQPVNYDLYWKGEIRIVHDPSSGGSGGGPTQNSYAYSSPDTINGDSDIWIDHIGAGGKFDLNRNADDLTDNDMDDLSPALSTPYIYPSLPPGNTKRWVAWSSNRGPSGNFQIFIWDLNPGAGPLHTFPQPIAVSSSTDTCIAPDWSPTNDAIICQCLDSRGKWAIRKYPVQIDPADATPPFIFPPVTLTRANTGDNTSPSYNRAGTYITFDSTRIRTDNAEIFVMSESGENTLLNRITYQNGHDRDPAFATGVGYDQILFQHQGTNWDIQVAAFTAGFFIPPVAKSNVLIGGVITSSSDDVNPAISPDGRQVIFASNRAASGAFDIYTANAAAGGGGDTKRTNSTDDQLRPDWGLDTAGS